MQKYANYILIVSIVFIIVLIINSLFLINIILKVGEGEKPSKIQVISITDKNCAACKDLSSIIDSIKRKNVEIVKENSLEFSSNEAKSLLSKYEVKKIPVVIIAGEIDNLQLANFKKFEKEGVISALILSEVEVPYVDVNTGNIKGMVSVRVINDKGCKECLNLSLVILDLKSQGVYFGEEKIIQYDSTEGVQIIQRYNLIKIPSIILSSDASDYSAIEEIWNQIGRKAADGSYILESFSPPYINSSTKGLVGLVNLVYIVDESCGECYNVSLHGLIIKSRGIKVVKEDIYDANSENGKELIKKYKIEAIPTVILSKETSAYTQFNVLWRTVGTIENDGSYVFRSVEVMGAPYKNLTSNEIVRPNPAE